MAENGAVSLNSGAMNMVYCGTAMFAVRAIESEYESTNKIGRKKVMGNQISNTSGLRDNTDKIEHFLAEIRQLQNIIGNSHYMINSLAHKPHLQEIHAEETLPLIDDYNYMVRELKELLKDQFEWDHELGKPINMRYWKLYYELDIEDLYY